MFYEDFMKIYSAPLEGITTYIFRNAYNEIYGHIDKFFAPFISPAENNPIPLTRDKKDIAPENNIGINLVPQILTCRSGCFIEAAKELHKMGYREINLNLGCPSGTHKDIGKDKDRLQRSGRVPCSYGYIQFFPRQRADRSSENTV